MLIKQKDIHLKFLSYTLKLMGMDKNRIFGILLLLSKSEKAQMEMMSYLISNPRRPLDDVMDKALEIGRSLPKELQPMEFLTE